MGRRTPGLVKRGEVWHIDKKIYGQRICESTGSSKLEEAKEILAHRCDELRDFKRFGICLDRSFREAATKYLLTNQHKATIGEDARNIQILDKYIGALPLPAVHMGSLEKYLEDRRKDDVKNRTINHGLQVTRRILNLAATEWRDENGKPWLVSAPKIKLLRETDKREPYPLSWEEQQRLFRELPKHLEALALFAVNTGCREGELCKLRWEWEVLIPELNTSVFIIPKDVRKKSHSGHVVVLNRIARTIIDAQRQKHSTHVFTYRGKPIARLNNSAWKKARVRAGLKQVRIHDLRHTFGRRLRAEGVHFEDRQDLLGHKSSRVTTHYSSAEVNNLLIAAEKVCEFKTAPTLSLVQCKVAHG
jgi:integrase